MFSLTSLLAQSCTPLFLFYMQYRVARPVATQEGLEVYCVLRVQRNDTAMLCNVLESTWLQTMLNWRQEGGMLEVPSWLAIFARLSA